MNFGCCLFEKCTISVFNTILNVYGHTCGRIGTKKKIGFYGQGQQIRRKFVCSRLQCNVNRSTLEGYKKRFFTKVFSPTPRSGHIRNYQSTSSASPTTLQSYSVRPGNRCMEERYKKGVEKSFFAHCEYKFPCYQCIAVVMELSGIRD